jgi:hypothetical protein
MKNNLNKPSIVTEEMKDLWKDFCGNSKMPRSPEKFLRKFIRLSNRDLRSISLILKAIVLDSLKDQEESVYLVQRESEFLEKKLSQVYDSCSSRARYKNKIEKTIQLAIKYQKQAEDLTVYCINRSYIRRITSETLVVQEHYEVQPKFFLSESSFKFN